MALMSALPEPGDVFAGYKIESELGRGGMGVVFRVRSLSIDRLRALKVIDPELSTDEVFAARFRREARLAASVEHPNVVRVFHAGEENGLLYLVTSTVEGSDLGELLRQGPLSPDQAIPILHGIASALDAAHAQGLIHRDVKPANILIEGSRNGERAYLTDFGISKEVQLEEPRSRTAATAVTRGSELLGTADYVAPEQVDGSGVDGRGDIYSLACVAFQMLTGSTPFARDSELATLVAHTNAPRPSARALNPNLPAALDQVLKAGMSADREERSATATELVNQIESALSGHRLPRPLRRRRWAAARRPVALALGGAALLVAVAFAAAEITSEGSTDQGSDSSGMDGPQPQSAKPTVRTAEVGEGPLGVAVADQVWVASRDAGALYRLRRGRLRSVGQPISVPTPVAVAVGFGSAWSVSTEALYRVDLSGAGEPLRIGVGAKPSDVTVGRRWVWVSNEDGDSVSRIDPRTNAVDATIAAPDEPRAIVYGAGSVWVACAGAGSVVRIDPEEARLVGKAVSAGSRPTAIASGAGAIWVTDNARGTLRKIDARSGLQVGNPIETEPKPRGVDVGLDAIWVASGQSGTLERFDPESTESIGGPIRVGPDPADVAVGPRAAYTANFDGASITQATP